MYAPWLDPETTDKEQVQEMLDAIPKPVLTPRVVIDRAGGAAGVSDDVLFHVSVEMVLDFIGGAGAHPVGLPFLFYRRRNS